MLFLHGARARLAFLTPRLGAAAFCVGGLLTSLARAELPPSLGRDVQITEEAKRRFKVGVEYLHDPDAPRYEDAYREFIGAYLESRSWKILGNLAIAASKLERNGDAIAAWERYLAEGDSTIDADERRQVQKDIALARAGSGHVVLSGVRLESVVDTRLRSSGPLVNVYKFDAPDAKHELVVQVGRHVFVARVGGKEARWEIDVEPGKTYDHVFTEPAGPPVVSSASASSSSSAPPPAPPGGRPPLQTAGLVTGAVGAALLVGGAITGVMTKSRYASLEDKCPANRCPAGERDNAESIKSLAKATNILFAVGGVLAAGGVTMFVLGNKKADDRVQVTAGPGGLSLNGAF